MMHQRQWDAADRRSNLERISTLGPRMDEFPIENPIMCGSFIIRRHSFITLNGYREDLPVHEDYNFHLRVLSSLRSKYVPTPVCTYHCRHAIPRLNHRRLFWFATSALNHSIYRALFSQVDNAPLKIWQRENQCGEPVACTR